MLLQNKLLFSFLLIFTLTANTQEIFTKRVRTQISKTDLKDVLECNAEVDDLLISIQNEVERIKNCSNGYTFENQNYELGNLLTGIGVFTVIGSQVRSSMYAEQGLTIEKIGERYRNVFPSELSVENLKNQLRKSISSVESDINKAKASINQINSEILQMENRANFLAQELIKWSNGEATLLSVEADLVEASKGSGVRAIRQFPGIEYLRNLWDSKMQDFGKDYKINVQNIKAIEVDFSFLLEESTGFDPYAEAARIAPIEQNIAYAEYLLEKYKTEFTQIEKLDGQLSIAKLSGYQRAAKIIDRIGRALIVLGVAVAYVDSYNFRVQVDNGTLALEKLNIKDVDRLSIYLGIKELVSFAENKNEVIEYIKNLEAGVKAAACDH